MVSLKSGSKMAKSFILNGNHEKFIIMAVSAGEFTVIALRVTAQCAKNEKLHLLILGTYFIEQLHKYF